MQSISNNQRVQELLIYLHIPKAAGTTLNGIINQQYSKKQLFRFDGINNKNLFVDLPQHKKDKIKLIRGHFAFGLHQFIDRPCIYFTVLRHPVKRVISQYNYIRNNPDNPQNKLLNSISLEEYISREKEALCNQQTRMIFGLSKDKVQTEDDYLRVAQNNLDKHFAVTGISDMFDETLLMLKRKFGWNMPYYVRQNTSKKGYQTNYVTDAAVRLITKYGDLDIKLYEYAKKNLQQMIVQQGESFANELKAIEKLNQIYQPFGKTYSYFRQIVLESKKLN